MGHGFGELYHKMRIITIVLSPFELKAFGGLLTKGIPRTFRRFREEVFYVVPPFIWGYYVYSSAIERHYQLGRKNPADFEDDADCCLMGPPPPAPPPPSPPPSEAKTEVVPEERKCGE